MKGAVKGLFRSPRWQWLLLPASAAGFCVYAVVLGKSYPIAQWLVWQLAHVWCGAILFNVGAVSLGYVLVTRALRQRDLPLIETAVASFAVGLTAMMWLFAIAGSAGLFRPWLAVALAVVATMCGGRSLVADFAFHKGEVTKMAPRGRIAALAAAAGVCATFFIYLLVMTPDVLANDGTSVYLLAAQDYVRTGKWTPFYFDVRRGMPELPSLLYTWAFLWPGLSAAPLRWMEALHLEFSCLLWTLAGIAAAARWMLAEAEVPSTWTVFFLFPIAFVYSENLGGGAEQVLAIFAVPMFLASMRLLERFEWSRVVLLGVIVGGTLLAKYQGVYLIAGNAVLLAGAYAVRASRIFRGRKGQGERRVSFRSCILAPAVVGVSALVVLSPYLAKNWAYYGNALYPLAHGAVDVVSRTKPKAAHDVISPWVDPSYVPKGPVRASLTDALRLGVTWPFDVHNDADRKVPMLGSLFVLLSPFALIVRGRRRIWPAIVVVYVATVTWALAYVFDRDLQMLVPLMAAISAAIIVRAWALGRMARAAVVPVIALQLIWGGDALFYFGGPRIMASSTLISSGFGRRTEKRFQYRAGYIATADDLPKDARVLCHAERRLLGFDRDLVFDSPVTQDTVRYDGVGNVRGLYDYYKALGITHLLWSQATPAEHSKKIEVLFAEFVTRHAKVRKTIGNLKIANMPSKRPSADRNDQKVLVLGTAYKNGLYLLDQLSTVERPGVRLPGPTKAVDVHKGLTDAIQSASAIVVGNDGDAVHDALEQCCRVAVRYADHDIYLPNLKASRSRR